LPATDWSATALAPFRQGPWHRQGAAPAVDDDHGPGTRSGFGSWSARPYLVKSLAGKLAPEPPPKRGEN
jgi:hypothetical protein